MWRRGRIGVGQASRRQFLEKEGQPRGAGGEGAKSSWALLCLGLTLYQLIWTLTITGCSGIIIPIIHMKKPRLREAMQIALGAVSRNDWSFYTMLLIMFCVFWRDTHPKTRIFPNNWRTIMIIWLLTTFSVEISGTCLCWSYTSNHFLTHSFISEIFTQHLLYVTPLWVWQAVLVLKKLTIWWGKTNHFLL